MANHKLVGNRIPRHDSWSKVKGEQMYSDDFSMPQMLIGRTLRSEYPAAILKSVDTSAAEALPGVACIMTAKDVPNNIDITKFGQMRDVGGGFEGLYKVLADGKIRNKSDVIALVAAETDEIAEEACSLIKVEYELTEGVFDPRDSLKEGAYLVSGEDDSNEIMKSHVEKGNVEDIFNRDDVIVIENDYYVGPQDHAYLETESGTAWIDENGVITLRVGTQVLEHYRTIAKILGLPHTKLRNISVLMGGGFGGKEDITVECYLALLTWKTRRPVKMVWSREESLEVHNKRHPEYMRYKTAATKDGKILAQKVDIVMDGSGYTYLTPWVQMYSTINASGCYDIPNVDVNIISAFTNNTLTSANRGFGACQVNFAYESQMDELADALDLDKLEIRRINCLKNGDEICTGFVPEGHVALKELIDMAWEGLEEYGPKEEYTSDGKKIGRGIAIGMMSYGRLTFMHDSSRVALRVELDGSVTVRAGVPDLGGGQGSVLCQIIAEELGLPIEDAHVYVMDTHLTPLCGTTTATRQLYMSGNAALTAVKPIRERIINKAAKLLGVEPHQVDLADRKAYVINNPDDYVPFVEVVAHVSNDGEELFNEGQFNAPFTEVPNLMNIRGRIHPDFTYSAHAVEVAVDMETGQYDITKIVAAFDVGRAINRNSCEGQLEGGAIYNMWYCREDLKWTNGYTKCNSFSTYHIPTSLDAPEVKLKTLESGGGLGPYGAKGVGEPADNSITPAVANALKDATGVRFTHHPINQEVVLAGILKKKAEDNN